MKRGGELKRTTGLKPGTKGLQRSAMARGTVALKARAPMKAGIVALKRAATPIRQRSKTNADPRPKTGEAALCKGQACYLRIPGICTGMAHDPCHSNQAAHGKGKGIKAHDVYTVPGCRSCHNEIDQGMRYTRAEKFALWDAAYERWRPVRAHLLQAV